MLVAGQVASKATRDALFLGQWGVSLLPWAMLASALASLAAAFGFSSWLRRVGPARALTGLLLVSAASFLVEWWLLSAWPGWIAWSLYLHVALAGALVMSGFWGIYSEVFDPRHARQLMGRVGAGATLGGLLGGLGAERVAHTLGARGNLLLLALLQLVGALLLTQWSKGAPDASRGQAPSQKNQTEQSPLASAPGQVRPYLRQLAVLGLLTSLSGVLVDFAFKASASETLTNESELVRFFALFYALAGLAGLLSQLLVAGRSLRAWGIGGTLALLPAVTTLLAFPAFFTQRFAWLIALRASSTALSVSTHRSGYELLYNPLSTDQKRSFKAWVDSAADKAGDAIGSLLLLGLLAFFPVLAQSGAVALAGGAALLALALTFYLQRGYVALLARNLKEGTLDVLSLHVGDATTQRTLHETNLGLDRSRLLSEIEQLQAANEGAAEPQPDLSTAGSSSPASLGSERSEEAKEREKIAQLAIALMSGSSAQRRELLSTTPLPGQLGGLLILLLGDPSTKREARAHLGAGGLRYLGSLHDALLDSQISMSVRRQIPSVLKTIEHPRSAGALLDALRDTRFELRYRSSQALVELARRDPQLVQPEPQLVGELVLQELTGGEAKASFGDPASSDSLLDSAGDEVDGGWLSQALRRRMRHRLEHTFSLLSLGRDPAPLRACLLALYGDDPRLRGTALEYLENILSPPIRAALWPYLETPPHAPARAARSRQQVLDELLAASRVLASDLPGSPSE